MTRIIGIVCFIFCSALMRPASADDFVLSLGMKQSVLYPVDQWVPVNVDVRNNTGAALDGSVDMPILGEESSVTYSLPVHLPAHSRMLQTVCLRVPERLASASKNKKDAGVPPVTFAQLLSRDGAVRARSEMLAQPLLGSEQAETPYRLTPALTMLLADDYNSAPSADTDDFLRMLQKAGGYRSVLAHVEFEQAPRHRAAYDGVRVVLLGGGDPNRLDAAQRGALLSFVRGGGVLVVGAPSFEVVGSSWLAEYLPVRLIGERLNDRVKTDSLSFSLIENAAMTEALAGEGEVVLADAHYVHAATRSLGLGRIVFTSFPLNALKQDDKAAVGLWDRLLTVESPPLDWGLTKLDEVRDEALSRMIGKKVAPWGLAAGVTGAYLLLVVGAQLLINGAHRPRAFGVTLGIAGLISVGLVAAGFAGGSEQRPMGARLATLDLAGDGGGVMREVVAYVGRTDDDFTLTASGDQSTLDIAKTFTRGDNPVIEQQPFAAPRAAMLQESYQRVWRAESSLPVSMKLSPVAQFDEQGLKVKTINELGAAVESPAVVWNDAVMPLGETLAEGQSVRSPLGAEGSMLVSGQDKLRETILGASLAPNAAFAIEAGGGPMLVGFLPEGSAPKLIETSAGADLAMRTQALVRAPLVIEPTEIGREVRVPAGLVEMVLDTSSMGLPYDRNQREWIATQQEQIYMLGFVAPGRIGTIQPQRATVSLNINAPRYRVSLSPRSNPQAKRVWDAPVAPQEAEFELSPADADANGVVWMNLEVARLGERQIGEVPAPWKMRWMRVGLSGKVTGPPRGESLDSTNKLED